MFQEDLFKENTEEALEELGEFLSAQGDSQLYHLHLYEDEFSKLGVADLEGLLILTGSPISSSGEPPSVPDLSGVAGDSLSQYEEYIHRHRKSLSADQVKRIATAVLSNCRKYGLDPRLEMAVIQCESDFNPLTRSGPGAMGLGQIMPANAKDWGVSDPFNIEQNVYASVRELRSYLDTWKGRDAHTQLILSLASYNAGLGNVRKYGNNVPPFKETQRYVVKVSNLYFKLKTILGQ